jgi:hypothetical protein
VRRWQPRVSHALLDSLRPARAHPSLPAPATWGRIINLVKIPVGTVVGAVVRRIIWVSRIIIIVSVMEHASNAVDVVISAQLALQRASHASPDNTKTQSAMSRAQRVRPTPVLRVTHVTHWLDVRATSAIRDPTEARARLALPELTKTRPAVSHAQRVRPVQRLPSQVRRVLPVLSLIATPGTPARAAVRARHALLGPTKTRAVQRHARRVRPTPGLPVAHVTHWLDVRAISVIRDPTAVPVRLALLEPTKTRPAVSRAQRVRPTPGLPVPDVTHWH